MTGVHAGYGCGHLREKRHLEDIGVNCKIILNTMRRHELD
jgi:hypothetical protein